MARRLDGLQLPGITGQDQSSRCFPQPGWPGRTGRGGDHRGLVDQQQDALGDIERAAAAALAGQVTQELGGVVRLVHAGGQGVAGGLRGRDPDDRPSSGGPDPGGFGHHPRLARPGRSVDHRDALAVGQHRQHSRGLMGSQLRTFGIMILNFLRASGQRVLESPGRRRVLARCRRAACCAEPRPPPAPPGSQPRYSADLHTGFHHHA